MGLDNAEIIQNIDREERNGCNQDHPFHISSLQKSSEMHYQDYNGCNIDDVEKHNIPSRIKIILRVENTNY
jgi:hypothetical protein